MKRETLAHIKLVKFISIICKRLQSSRLPITCLLSLQLVTATLLVPPVAGQHPLKDPADAIEIRYARNQPVIAYTLRVDNADLSGYDVVMHLRNVPDTFRVAMMAHPEYDDRYWRFLKRLRVETGNGQGNVVREDSALWRITITGGAATLTYRIVLPPNREGQRPAWRPFLSPTGGLTGGPHAFLYVPGATLAPAHISLQLPAGWMAATGLIPTSDPTQFFAPSATALVDAPIFIGHFKSWPFTVEQVPHRIIYWPVPGSPDIDSSLLVSNVQKIVQQAARLFGRLPYREYTFLFQDGAYGALEHINSITLGLPSDQFAKDVPGFLNEIAHEYFHNWNLVRIHPAEWTDITYRDPPLAKGLWWGEGLTLFYADLLLRRAKLPVTDTSRITHLEGLLAQYYGSSGNMYLSPEKVSFASNGPPGMLGNYNATPHLQGEVLGNILDMIIRNATDQRFSIDDVMRRMMEKFSGEKGFTSRDVESVVTSVCHCEVKPFFLDHVYGNRPIPFNTYLQLAGLQSRLSWSTALNPDSTSAPDLRVYAYQLPGKSEVLLGILDPDNCWTKAGLHTGDKILSVNNTLIRNAGDFRRLQAMWQIGDTVNLQVEKNTGVQQKKVRITGYKEPVIHISQLPVLSGRQRSLLTAWLHPL